MYTFFAIIGWSLQIGKYVLLFGGMYLVVRLLQSLST